MTEFDTDTLYRKEGRRYKPAFSIRRWDYDGDAMKVGTFRLTHAYDTGARRYEYDVTPDTASVVAALVQYRTAIEKAIADRAVARPSGSIPYTKRQLAIIEEFREKMAKAGGMLPTYWVHASAFDISEAAVNALREALAAQQEQTT